MIVSYVWVVIMFQVQFGINLHECFKKLKLNEPLHGVQFHLLKKLTSANEFQIEQEKPYDYLIII